MTDRPLTTDRHQNEPAARRWLEILVSLATLAACFLMFLNLEWSIAKRDSDITTQGEKIIAQGDRIKALEENQHAMTDAVNELKISINDGNNQNKLTSAALDATNRTLQFTNEQLSQFIMGRQPQGKAP